MENVYIYADKIIFYPYIAFICYF